MRPIVLKIATLALALGVLGVVVANAALSSSCAKPQQPAAGMTGNAGADPSTRFLPATKSGRVLTPREVSLQGEAPKTPPPRYFPATKAAPVMLPGEVRGLGNPAAPTQAPNAPNAQKQQSVEPGAP